MSRWLPAPRGGWNSARPSQRWVQGAQLFLQPDLAALGAESILSSLFMKPRADDFSCWLPSASTPRAVGKFCNDRAFNRSVLCLKIHCFLTLCHMFPLLRLAQRCGYQNKPDDPKESVRKCFFFPQLEAVPFSPGSVRPARPGGCQGARASPAPASHRGLATLPRADGHRGLTRGAPRPF